jgi:hypothetical protein
VKKYIIERDIPAVGTLAREELRAAAAKSNEVLRTLAPKAQWVQSYVTADKLFCIYLADSPAVIQEHARLSGFPAHRVTEIGKVIDPSTANGAG